MSLKKQRTESSPNAAAKHDNDGEEKPLEYLTGFAQELKSEALPGALPPFGNTPQKCPYGLYAEQISGTAFTKKRCANQRSWVYRIRPTAADHGPWKNLDSGDGKNFKVVEQPTITTPEQYRWLPLPMPTKPTNFVEGLVCYAGAGGSSGRAGLRIHLYAANKDMGNSSFYSADGDFLIVPERGTLFIATEFGKMEVPPNFIAVIQRGIRFSVNGVDAKQGIRGYVCEAYDSHFELPPMGAIGSNGLSNARDFETPVACYEDRDGITWTNYVKYNEQMWAYEQPHSPFDVVAWHGNYAPYRYDLAKYCVVNSVSFDHLDPCTFAVLTAQTGEPGVASCDFVIFPPRWMVQENTFRPPYYHRNAMSEFMGNIRGAYEAKTSEGKNGGGFFPGGASLHSHMSAHGPESAVFEKASNATLTPTPPNRDALAFMFESYYTLLLTPYAATNNKDEKYLECYKGFKKHFNPNKK